MKILKNKLLGIVNTENELEFDENPFVRLIRINNTVYYFRGLYMKLWATGPVLYKTLKINKSYSFSYGRGAIRNSDGQDTIQTINFISNGKRDSEGYLAFTPSSDAYGVPMDTVVFRVKEGSTPDKIWLKTPTGTTEDETEMLWSEEEVDCYQVDTNMSNEEFTYYYILKLSTPGSGYVDFIDTVGPCEGKKIYCHDEYFMFDDSSYSAITKIEFSKEVTEIPLGAFSNLYNLTEISLPKKLTQIGRTSFWYCQSLSSITIPENVTFIDAETFDRCDNLTDIYFDNYLVNLPENSPWGAPNAIVRCRDGYYEGPLRYACLKHDTESEEIYRHCWGLDMILNSGQTYYAFIKQDDYDTYHNRYFSTPIQGGSWKSGVEEGLNALSEIVYYKNVDGLYDYADGYVANKSASGITIGSAITYTSIQIEGDMMTCPFGTFQHYDFLDYTDSTYGQLYGFCNRYGYTQKDNEAWGIFIERWREDIGDATFYDVGYGYNLQVYYTNVLSGGTDFGFIWKGDVTFYNNNQDIHKSVSTAITKSNRALIIPRTTSEQGSVVLVTLVQGTWFPSVLRRFAPLDIHIGNKTYYAFGDESDIDRYYSEGYGDTFDFNAVSGFTNHNINLDGFNSTTITGSTIIYLDSLNLETSTYIVGYVYHNQTNGGYCIDYEGNMGVDYIGISGDTIVSAIKIFPYLIEEEMEDGPAQPTISRYPSDDKVIDGVTYYCFQVSNSSEKCYLSDITEGTKHRFFFTNLTNNGRSVKNSYSNELQFLTSYNGIENVTANSGNTLTLSETYDDEQMSVTCHYFAPYNITSGSVTFYAYLEHGAYRTAKRILDNEESGITSVNDTKFLLAMTSENPSTLAGETEMIILYHTDISQGAKQYLYAGYITAEEIETEVGEGESEYSYAPTVKFIPYSRMETTEPMTAVIYNRPNLDSEIDAEIEQMSSGNSSSDSGTNVTSMEITITSPNGVDTYPTTVMTFNVDGTNHTAVRFAPYDYYDASTSTQYYAFIWETCYNHMLALSGDTVDAYDTEFIQTLMVLNPQDEFDGYFLTSENSMNILYVTRVETGSTLPELYLRSVWMDYDDQWDLLAQWGEIKYDREANGQITIQNYPSGFVVAGSGDGGNSGNEDPGEPIEDEPIEDEPTEDEPTGYTVPVITFYDTDHNNRLTKGVRYEPLDINGYKAFISYDSYLELISMYGDETINPVSFSTIDTMSTAIHNSQSMFFNDGNDMNVVYIPTSDYVSSGTIVTDIYTRTVYLDNDTEPLEWASLHLEYEDATCQISNETFQYTLYYEM